MIDKAKIEQLLLKNWSDFLSTQKLFLTALSLISATTFSIVKTSKIPEGDSVKLSVSQLTIVEDGLKLWLEFFVPKENAAILGTIDCLMKWDGTFIPLDVVGTKLTSE